MGIGDLLRRDARPAKRERPGAREVASAAPEDEGGLNGAVNKLISVLLDVGLDGLGPLDSATEVADQARAENRSTEAAVKKVARSHLVGGAVGGFATGLGGFVTMPVALPVNVVEFYVQATRMVGAIATLRGYDVTDPHVRTAVLLTLVGSHADEVLRKAGISTATGRATELALKRLPPAALMVVNKALGFRLLRGVGEKAFTRLGRGVPVVGGLVGGGLDGWMMKRIADHAMKEFPSRRPISG